VRTLYPDVTKSTQDCHNPKVIQPRDSVGVEAVLVNGELAWTPAGYTDAKAGRICEMAG